MLPPKHSAPPSAVRAPACASPTVRDVTLPQPKMGVAVTSLKLKPPRSSAIQKVPQQETLLFADRMHEPLETLRENRSVLEVRAAAKRLGIVDRETDYDDHRWVPTDDDFADGPEGNREKARWWFAVDA
jgi:hypothetical protein